MKFHASFPVTAETFLNNRALNYGDGLFETMLVCEKKIALWDLHFQRLDDGFRRLNLESLSKGLLLDKILSLVDDKQSYIAKLVVIREDVKRGYHSDSSRTLFFITLNQYRQVPINDSLTVSSVKLSEQKQLAGLKHLNRLEQVLAAQELNQSKYSDAIMLDNKHNVIETISKNIVLIKGNKLVTPKLNKCGVYGVALRWLQQQGFDLKWKKIEFKSLQKYDGLMVCNSIQGFTAIRNIDKKIHYNKPMKITKKIQMKWQEYVC